MRLVNNKKYTIGSDYIKTIPVFYACDDGYVKYLYVSMKSLIENASRLHRINIHILHEDITEEHQKQIKKLETLNVNIYFENVSEQFAKIDKNLPIRDYYSKTTYYRLFLPEMFKQYNKAIYIDGDTIVTGDICKMFRHQLGDNYVGAARDQVIAQLELFRTYTNRVLGIRPENYFNAGVLLINCKAFRKQKILKKFNELRDTYSFVVAQDQDYLNVICKNKVLWLQDKWNAQTVGKLACPKEDACIIHYNLGEKPWFYRDCLLADYFWKYAVDTPFYDELLEGLNNHRKEDNQAAKRSEEHLFDLAREEIARIDNYANEFGTNEERSLYRRKVLKKIEQYELQGRFDEDVEDDPPTIELKPEDIDYFHRSMKERIQTRYTYRIARWFLNTMIRKKQFVVKDIVGIENFKNLKSGAVITCNHFNPLDVLAVQVAYEAADQKKRKLYRVIREGNYTNFHGFYGVLMRHCDTLPLSSNKQTMKKFLSAVDVHLKKGNFVMIYPEQSLWWNYRKPKPLKRGGYVMAANNNVPVLPIFITMEDTDVLDGEGFPVQAYTINIGAPIYPDKKKSRRDAADEMMRENFRIWKRIYETTYGIPLNYTTLPKLER